MLVEILSTENNRYLISDCGKSMSELGTLLNDQKKLSLIALSASLPIPIGDPHKGNYCSLAITTGCSESTKSTAASVRYIWTTRVKNVMSETSWTDDGIVSRIDLEGKIRKGEQKQYSLPDCIMFQRTEVPDNALKLDTKAEVRLFLTGAKEGITDSHSFVHVDPPPKQSFIDSGLPLTSSLTSPPAFDAEFCSDCGSRFGCK